MAVYMVSYDLNREVVRPKIVDKIKETGDGWARISESCYAISTTMSVEGVHGVLKPMIDDNDNIYIITLKRPYTGFGPKDVNDWLETNLTY